MCTIIVLHRVHPEVPTLVAANRDELYSREATAPRALCDRPRVLGGLDVAGGGTWMGVHESGFFAGLTNQRSFGGSDASLRSRGEITLEALAAGSVEGARRHLGSIDPRDYNSFNLVYGDAERLEVAYARRETGTVEVEALGPGVHVLTNDRMGSPDFPKAQRAEGLVEPLTDRPLPELAEALRGVLSDHDLPALEAVPEPPPGSIFDRALVRRLQALCIHTPAYGTRSATLLALSPGRVARYLFAPGPPCTTPFEEVSDSVVRAL